MSSDSSGFEYPDTAGYPDGSGFLDEGTAPSGPVPAAEEVDTPSADADDDIAIVSDAVSYRAMLGATEVAVMHVVRDGELVTLTSTVVDADVRDRGIATSLIAHVLDELRDGGHRIRVQCPEVAAFVAHHPEYADLVD